MELITAEHYRKEKKRSSPLFSVFDQLITGAPARVFRVDNFTPLYDQLLKNNKEQLHSLTSVYWFTDSVVVNWCHTVLALYWILWVQPPNHK